MKIQLLSDLHLEVHPDFVPVAAPDADLLVLAGDIGSYQNGSQLKDSDFGLARFSPRLGWPVPVLFVPGNHEYDAQDFDAVHARLHETCERLDIVFLERGVVTTGQLFGSARSAASSPTRFIGTTLWSDFDALGSIHPGAPTQTQLLQQRHKAFRAANYYLSKAGTTRQGGSMLAEQVREQALVCQDWLRNALAQPFEGKTVVVTHFAPSLQSADPRYGWTPSTAGFCNALDDLLARAALWLHGHLHCPADYLKQGCRVVANPLGYARKQEQAGFKATASIELPDDARIGD